MRAAVSLVAAALLSAPASAQTSAPPVPSQALAGIWRPVTGPLTPAALAEACVGAREEMAAVESALPEDLSPAALLAVRPPRGLLIAPNDAEPRLAYFFAPPAMPWFASGLGAATLLSAPEGLIGVRDAAGTDIAFQLGRAGETPVIRVRPPSGPLLTFVGCASIG